MLHGDRSCPRDHVDRPPSMRRSLAASTAATAGASTGAPRVPCSETRRDMLCSRQGAAEALAVRVPIKRGESVADMLNEERASKGDQVDRPPSMRSCRSLHQLPASTGGNAKRLLTRLLAPSRERKRRDSVNEMVHADRAAKSDQLARPPSMRRSLAGGAHVASTTVSTTVSTTTSSTTTITTAVAAVAKRIPIKRGESVADMLDEDRASKGDQVDRPPSMRRSQVQRTEAAAQKLETADRLKARFKKQREAATRECEAEKGSGRSDVSPEDLLGSTSVRI